MTPKTWFTVTPGDHDAIRLWALEEGITERGADVLVSVIENTIFLGDIRLLNTTEGFENNLVSLKGSMIVPSLATQTARQAGNFDVEAKYRGYSFDSEVPQVVILMQGPIQSTRAVPDEFGITSGETKENFIVFPETLVDAYDQDGHKIVIENTGEPAYYNPAHRIVLERFTDSVDANGVEEKNIFCNQRPYSSIPTSQIGTILPGITIRAALMVGKEATPPVTLNDFTFTPVLKSRREAARAAGRQTRLGTRQLPQESGTAPALKGLATAERKEAAASIG